MTYQYIVIITHPNRDYTVVGSHVTNTISP